MRTKGWTLDTLKEYFDTRLDAQKDAIAIALTAAEKATTKAEAAADKRAEASNEIRQAMIDQQAGFATKETADSLSKRLDLMEKMAAASAGKSQGAGSLASAAAQVLTGLGVLAAIGLGLFSAFHHPG